MDGAVGKLGGIFLVATLAAFNTPGLATSPARLALPDPAEFAREALTGKLQPEAFDFAAAGFWNLPKNDQLMWAGMANHQVGFGQPVGDECAPEAQRSFATGTWIMLLNQSADDAEWKAANGALREALAKLDARLARVPSNDSSTDPVVRELLSRYARDQDIRGVFTEPQWTLGMPPLAAKNWMLFFTSRMTAIDCDNTAWLRAQLQEIGWFSIPKYGVEADSAAWHLVQHADRSKDFQREMLAKLQALPPGDTDSKRVGYLWDRVAMGEGRPQRYGTQGRCENGQWTPNPTEDPEHLDERRAALGMKPIAQHAEVMSRESCPR